MAHFVLEYSNNLGETPYTIQVLLDELHQAAEQLIFFPLKGIRSRAYCCDMFRVADGNSEHGFCHLEVKIGTGRTTEQKQLAADLFIKIFTEHFSINFEKRGIALSFEITEIQSAFKFNKNNILENI